jgi:death-on-curing protein
VRYLTSAEVLFIHQDQIEKYGGSPELRDSGLLESALAQPAATFGGEDLHQGIFLKAAAYLYHICCNHPFLDGNNRTALASALVFLELNGATIEDPDEILYDVVIGVATGELSKEVIAESLEVLSKGGKTSHNST